MHDGFWFKDLITQLTDAVRTSKRNLLVVFLNLHVHDKANFFTNYLRF